MGAKKENLAGCLHRAKQHFTRKKMILSVVGLLLAMMAVAALYRTATEKSGVSMARYSESIGREGLRYKYGECIYNPQTGEILLDSIEWLYTKSYDTIGIVAKQNRRAYINLNTAQLLTPLEFDKAWIFGSNRGVMIKNDSVYIFRRDGSQVNATPFPYNQEHELVYYHDRLVLKVADDKVGLLDTAAQWLLPPEFTYINNDFQHNLYSVKRGDVCTVYSYDLQPILNGNYRQIDIDWTEGLVATEYSGAQRLFDYEGKLLYANIYKSIQELTYDTGKKDRNGDPIGESTGCYVYASYNGKKGLMDRDYQPLTPPLFYSIEAQTKYVFFASFGKHSSEFGTLIDNRGKQIH